MKSLLIYAVISLFWTVNILYLQWLNISQEA